MASPGGKGWEASVVSGLSLSSRLYGIDIIRQCRAKAKSWLRYKTQVSILLTNKGETIDNIAIPKGGEYRRQVPAELFPLHQPSFGMAQNNARFLQHLRLVAETPRARSHHCLPLHRLTYLSQHRYLVAAKALRTLMPVPLLAVMSTAEMSLIEDNRMGVHRQWYQVLELLHQQLVQFA